MTTILPAITVNEFDDANLEIVFMPSPIIAVIGNKPFKVTGEHFVYFCNPAHTIRYRGGIILAYCAYYFKSEVSKNDESPLPHSQI